MTCKNFYPLWGSWTVGGRKSRKRRRKSKVFTWRNINGLLI